MVSVRLRPIGRKWVKEGKHHVKRNEAFLVNPRKHKTGYSRFQEVGLLASACSSLCVLERGHFPSLDLFPHL